MTVSMKIKKLTLAFQEALRADIFKMEKTGEVVNLKINDAATAKEKENIAEMIEASSKEGYLGRPRADIQASLSFKMAEIKSAIADRAGLTNQLAGYVDVAQTNQKTASQLEAAGAPHFAKVVRLARQNSKQQPK